MSGLNYLKLGSTLSNICNTIQLDNATKCHYAFKNFWGEPWSGFMKFQLLALNYYEQMITNNPFKCIDLPYSKIIISFVLKAFADHNWNAAPIIGFGIHKLNYCGGRRKYWFPAILYNSTLTLKAF